MVYIYNPSYLEGRGRMIVSSRTALEKLVKSFTKKKQMGSSDIMLTQKA
jgi:hypothetical protein